MKLWGRAVLGGLLLPATLLAAVTAAPCGETAMPKRSAALNALEDGLGRYARATGIEVSDLARRVPAPALPKETPPLAASEAASITLEGFLSAWTQVCGDGCSLPEPAERNVPAKLDLRLPAKPGEATAAKLTRTFDLGAHGALKADLSVYALCPAGESQAAGPPCASLFFRVQLELSGAAQAFCSLSLNAADAAPFPVAACAGASKDEPARRAGVTLHRKPL